MKMKNILLIMMIIMLGASCSTTSDFNLNPGANKKTIKKAPDWFLEVPVKDGLKYYSGTGVSPDMQLAIKIAMGEARTTCAQFLEVEADAFTKSAKEQTALDNGSNYLNQFSETWTQKASAILKDLSPIEQEFQIEQSGGGSPVYRAYVLLAWDENAANERLLNEIKQDQQLFNAIRATELFEEMEEKVNAYRERKNQE